MTTKAVRLLLGAVLPAGLVAAGYVPFLLLRSELPDPLASHFNSSGVPDGSMSPSSFAILTGVLALIGALLCVGIAITARPPKDGTKRSVGSVTGVGLAATGGFLCAFGSGILLETLLTQRGIADWTKASSSWTLTLLAFAFGLLGAAAAARLANLLPGLQPESNPNVGPVMDLADSEHAVWSASLRSLSLTVLGIASGLFAAFLAVATGVWVIVVVALVSAVAILSIANLRVTADRQGLHVRYGVLPWPRTDVRVEQIKSASVIDVRPRQWGGWGYRGSLTLMKQAAVVLRAGPGIRLDLRNGKVFVITIDNPDAAVGLLNAQIQRS